MAAIARKSGCSRYAGPARRRRSGSFLDRLEWVKFASIAWTRDGSGFYYLRFPEPGSVPPEDEHYFGRIHFHRLGQPQLSGRAGFRATG
jgi:hypothetical protein